MNYLKNIKKINDLQQGGRIDFWRLVMQYNLSRIFMRPAAIRALMGNRYRNERKLLYTVVTGGYDDLNEIPTVLPGWDYVCFTDNSSLKSTTWRIRPISNDAARDVVRFARYWKLHNHLVDDRYDLSVYIDANIRVRGDLDSFVAHALPPGCVFSILEHPFLSSLREELEKCLKEGKDDAELLERQYHHYVDEKAFTDPYPQVNTRLMIRRTGRPEIRRLMETWFAQLQNWSRRDQMSFNYALSLSPDVRPHYIPYWLFRRHFKRLDHR